MRWFLLAAVLLAISVLLWGHEELPDLGGRSVSTTLTDTADTRLGRAIASRVAAHPGISGIVPLIEGRDAFAARFLLADAAERTLDIQYYIWHDDLSGTLLFESVHRAADRGVRVRLLLDDNNTVGLDQRLAALDAHPHIEVRLFNPFVNRDWRWLGYLTDFARLNRRMHNKSFTADNQATIIGGRNVGDEYFDVGGELLFADLDVLAIGPVVDDVSRDFDRYWASASSYPADRILAPADLALLDELSRDASVVARDPAAQEYLEAIAASAFMSDLLAARLPIEWAPTRLVSDDPAKGLGHAGDEGLLTTRLREAIGTPMRELYLVSPYFVPGAEGVDYFAGLVGRGVEVTVFTNSLEATDVAAVHSGYAKRRKPLLEAGVTLWEMKRKTVSSRLRDRGLPGSSASSLHAKTFSLDGLHVFIGSFNFDPRSDRLNTEMGFVIDSPVLAGQIADLFSLQVPANAYRLRIGDDGELQWVEMHDGHQVVHDEEPGTDFLDRAAVAVMSVLPIEWLL
ncbi:phospholipase D family protein [Lysobacter sp. A289]